MFSFQMVGKVYLFTAMALATSYIAAQPATLPPPPTPPAPPTTATQVATAPLQQRLDAIFDEPQWSNAHWGVLVKDLDTSTVLYARQPEKSVMPASNLKLFTSAAALATLGADYRFETKIYATGTTDTAGTLHGNIYIIGSGDPSISGRYLDTPTTAILAQWADAITSAGIRSIEGDIIGDDDIFDESAISGSWQNDYLQEWYAAENSGLAINDNCWDIRLDIVSENEGRKAGYHTIPVATDTSAAAYLKVIDPLQTKFYSIYAGNIKVVTEPSRRSGNLRISRNTGAGFSPNNITLEGTLTKNDTPLKEWGSISNGTLFTVTLLKEELDRRNIRVSGQPVDIDDVDTQIAAWLKANPGQLIHTHVSPPLSKILAIVNKPSQNFYADMLLKVVGAKVHGHGSWDNGQKVVEDLLTTAGVSTRSLLMDDGSGLSRRDLVEPNQVVALLTYMYGRPDFQVFEESLPIMGIDGTLRGRMAGTAAEGNVKAKTGTIGRVRALSGYLTAENGHRIVFSMIANNYYTPTSAATEAQNNAILEIMKP